MARIHVAILVLFVFFLKLDCLSLIEDVNGSEFSNDADLWQIGDVNGSSVERRKLVEFESLWNTNSRLFDFRTKDGNRDMVQWNKNRSRDCNETSPLSNSYKAISSARHICIREARQNIIRVRLNLTFPVLSFFSPLSSFLSRLSSLHSFLFSLSLVSSLSHLNHP